VLYEMLTGRRAFGGDDLADVLARVIEREPDFTLLPVSTPATVRTSLRRCLEKDRQRRLPDIGVVRLDIDDAAAAEPRGAGSGDAPAAAPRARARINGSVAASAAVLGLVVGAIAGGWWSQRGPRPASNGGSPLMRTMLELSPTAPLALGARVPQLGFDCPAIALTADGSRLAYVAESATGTLVFVRDLGGSEAAPVLGTEGAISVFFSPDGRWLGFLTDDRVKKVALDGSTPITLATVVNPVRATWTRGERIYVVEETGMRLSRVEPSGGAPVVVRPSDPGIRFSEVLPSERAALATAGMRSVSANYDDVVLVALASGEVTTLVESGYDPRFAVSGHLLFARGRGLFAVAFDPDAGRVTGDPIPVAGDLSADSLWGQAHVAAAANGLVAYVPGADRARGRLAWVDREGNVEDAGAPTQVYGVMDLSPDGARVAVHVADITDYIWLYDFARQEGRKLAVATAAGWPKWAPDGESLAFTSWSTSYLQSALVLQPVSGGSPTTLVPSTPGLAVYRTPVSWSPDGRVIATNTPGASARGEFVAVGHPERAAEARGRLSTFSPDGSWVADSTSVTGRTEVFIRSYPAADVTHQFSLDGGLEPIWCASGELFYRKGNRWFASAVRTAPELVWEPPREVFHTDFLDTSGRSYVVSPDGKRLLVVKRAEPDIRDRIHLISNWTSLLASAR
jgi:Tol biopolymer transport system component